MKLGKLFFVSFLGVALLATTSCCKDDPVREVVEDPAKTVEFYVKGQVVSAEDNAPLSGVQVTLGDQTVTTDAQGAYQVSLTQAGKNQIAFERSGYVSQTAQVDLSGSANRAILTVNARMFALSTHEVTVRSGEAAVVTNDENGSVATSEASIEIPALAVAEDVNISVTRYVPMANAAVQEETVVAPRTETQALKNIVITTSDVVVLEQPVTLNFKNTEGNATNFLKQVNVYRKADTRSTDGYELVGVAIFNPETNNYTMELQAGQILGGTYSLRVDYRKSATGVTTGATIYEQKVDNSSNYVAITFTHSFEASTGWEYLNRGAASDAELQLIEEIIVGNDGAQGVSKVPYSITSKISGNNILFFTVKQTQNDLTYEVETNHALRTVSTRKYLSIESSYINESADQHSGGSGLS